VLNTASSESVSRERRMAHPLPQMNREEQQRQKRKFLLVSNLPQQIRGLLQREPGLRREKRLRRKG
jgi:hypothetical protein